MPYRITPLVNNEIYHVYNRGVEKRHIFLDNRDFQRFLNTALYYQHAKTTTKFSETPPRCIQEILNINSAKIVEIFCYCLMPNHIHFMLKQIKDDGISIFMSKLTNSYTKYFNTKNKRVGPLFQGQFKAKLVENDDQLIHLSRYIHLNPLSSGIVKNLNDYQWSSYNEYVSKSDEVCNKSLILNMFESKNKYHKFITDYSDYSLSLEIIKKITLDN